MYKFRDYMRFEGWEGVIVWELGGRIFLLESLFYVGESFMCFGVLLGFLEYCKWVEGKENERWAIDGEGYGYVR